ncbi:MAG: hypothetical protein ABI426_01865 [Flavobacterium sp.]
MKKYFIILFVLLGIKNVNAQILDGYIVTNANDTIKSKFVVRSNDDNGAFYASSVTKYVKVIDSKGITTKYYPNQLKSFFINYKIVGDYKFVSLKADNYKKFYQEKISGKISFYLSYSDNIRGGYPLVFEHYLKNDELINDSHAYLNFRNEFGKFLEDYPELHDKWMSSNDYYKKRQVSEVIDLYNEHFKS